MTLVARIPREADHIITEKSAAELLGISVHTLRRQVARGEGPRRIRLSLRRVGYKVSDIDNWLETRGTH